MDEVTQQIWWITFGLGAASYAIRLGGFLLALHLPQGKGWARGMEALPGCLIVALVALMMLKGGPIEWCAGAVTLVTAAWTRSLPISMCMGMVGVAILRLLGE